MAYIPSSGSVVAFQGTSPWIDSTGNASVITASQGSVAAVIVGGSIAASFIPPANQSVSGTVGASIIGLPTIQTGNSSVISIGQGSIATVIIGGSIAASFTPPANQSVSGTVGASIIGLPPVNVTNTVTVVSSISGGIFPVSGSVSAVVTNFPTNQNVSGSVAAWLNSSNASVITLIQGSVAVSVTPPANQSVSGTVGASVIGTVPVTQSTTPWTISSIYGNVSGSIAGTYVNSNVASTVTGVAMMFKQNVSTSIMTEVSPTFPLPVTVPIVSNQSVSGTVGSSIIGQLPSGTAVLGSVATLQGTNPWVVSTGNASIITVGQGSIATVIIGGSILTSSTANQSVSGTVGASTIGTVPVTQGTTPWLIGSVYGNVSGSIAGTYTEPAVVTSVTGLAMMFKTNVSTSTMGVVSSTNPLPVTFPVTTNQSVSGTVGASIIGQLPGGTAVLGSVATLQGTNPWNIAGSVASFNVGNSSVISYVQNSVATVIIGGSIAATFTPPANQSVSGTVQVQGLNAPAASVTGNPVYAGGSDPNGSVAAFKLGANREAIITGSIQGTVSVLGTVPVTQSGAWNIAGSVAAVIIGGSVATATTNSSVMLLNSPNVIGSIATLQGTNPWIVTGSVQAAVSGSVVAFQGAGWSGSVLAVPTLNQSVSGTILNSPTSATIPATTSILVGVTANTNGSVLTTTGYPQALVQITSGPGASITGQINFEGTLDGTQFVPIQGYNLSTGAIASASGIESDWAFNVAGLQGIRGRVSNWSAGSITARAVVSPTDARPFSQNISGSVAATIVGQPIAVNPNFSSIIAIPTGSIISVPTGSVITVFQSSSVITTWKDSSVLANQAGTWRTSIAGTYANNAASVVSALGVATMGVRNDTLASVLATTNATYGGFTTGSWGDQIVSFAPSSVWTSAVASCFTGVEQPVIVSVLGRRVNVTGVQIANVSANNVYMTFYGAGIGSVTGSIIGYTVAPANGGSNINFPVPLQTANNSGFSASVSGVASVFISAQGFYSAV